MADSRLSLLQRRRSLVAAAISAAQLPVAGRAPVRRTLTEAAGRTVMLPERVTRIDAAGPPSVNRLLGPRWLARILYPRAFPGDLSPIVRDFYARCCHRTPAGAQLDQLLRAALPESR